MSKCPVCRAHYCRFCGEHFTSRWRSVYRLIHLVSDHTVS